MAVTVRRLKVRLTLTFLGLVTATVLVFVVGTAVVMDTQLRGELRRQVVLDLATLESVVVFDGYGHPYLRAELTPPVDSRYTVDRYFDILAPTGELLYRADRLGVGLRDEPPQPGEGVDGVTERESSLEDGTPVLLASRVRTFEGGHQALLRMAYPTGPVSQRVRDWVVDTLLSLGVMLLIAAVAAWELTRRALRPIDAMAAQVEQMSARHLHERLPVTGVDEELAGLARVFNGLLDRIARAVDRLKRFTAEASHELRTPLAAMRVVGEVGLERSRTPEEYREVIGSMLEDVDRITRLADTLLDLARVDAGGATLRLERVAVPRLLADAVDVVAVLAEERRQTVTVTGGEGLEVTVDPLRLHQALVNVLHNAVKFSPIDGAIRVSAARDGDGVVLAIVDSGPGVSEEQAAGLFDQFVQAGAAADDPPLRGAGLGLWIARAAVEAHGGRITLDRADTGGAVVRIRLPLS